MKVLVTGATGNVGTALMRHLARQPWADLVTGASRHPPAGPLPGATQQWRGLELGAPGAEHALEAEMHGMDAVVHLAWELQPGHDQERLRRTNVVGSRQVLSAARSAGVAHVVVVSSVGAYSPGPKSLAVDESWPTDGVPTSSYSRMKSAVERIMDEVEPTLPLLARIRPALVFQRSAAREVKGYFLGPLVPGPVLGRLRLPALPIPAPLSFQVVHADDVASAIGTVLEARAGGAFNVADEPLLTSDDFARALGAGRSTRLPTAVLRGVAGAGWLAHLQPSEPGWIDLATSVPAMSTHRLRELGWRPSRSGRDSLAELLEGMRDGVGRERPPLDMRPAA